MKVSIQEKAVRQEVVTIELSMSEADKLHESLAHFYFDEGDSSRSAPAKTLMLQLGQATGKHD